MASMQKTFVGRDVTESLTAASRSSAFDEPPLSAFGAGLQRMFLPGGQILFRENEVADSLYIVISGCLGVVVRSSNGSDVLVARIAAGETVGEMGLLDGGVRSATVEALRDTELLKFDKASYEDLLLGSKVDTRPHFVVGAAAKKDDTSQQRYDSAGPDGGRGSGRP